MQLLATTVVLVFAIMVQSSGAQTSCIATYGGSANGANCVFPFTFDEIEYNNECRSNSDNIAWCSTSVLTSSHGSGDPWGNCIIPTYGGTANGATCQFPFSHNGIEYKGCITEDSRDIPWCKTDSCGHWGYCNMSCTSSGVVNEVLGSGSSCNYQNKYLSTALVASTCNFVSPTPLVDTVQECIEAACSSGDVNTAEIQQQSGTVYCGLYNCNQDDYRTYSFNGYDIWMKEPITKVVSNSSCKYAKSHQCNDVNSGCVAIGGSYPTNNESECISDQACQTQGVNTAKTWFDGTTFLCQLYNCDTEVIHPAGSSSIWTMSTTMEESTTSIPLTTTGESTTSLPVITTEESTTSLVSLPLTTTEESTTSLPVTTTEESTTYLPLTTTEESTTSLPVTTTEESTTSLTLTTTEESTTSLPPTTTEKLTTSIPLTTSDHPDNSSAVRSCNLPAEITSNTQNFTVLYDEDLATIKIRLRCAQGYQPMIGDLRDESRDVEILCFLNGTLSIEFYGCQEYRSCSVPPVIANTNWTMTENNTVVYSCNNGYVKASGHSELNCSDGMWSTADLKCLPSYVLSDPISSALVNGESLTAHSSRLLANVGFTQSDTEVLNISLGFIVGMTFISLVSACILIADSISLKIHFRKFRKNQRRVWSQLTTYLHSKKLMAKNNNDIQHVQELVMADME